MCPRVCRTMDSRSVFGRMFRVSDVNLLASAGGFLGTAPSSKSPPSGARVTLLSGSENTGMMVMMD